MDDEELDTEENEQEEEEQQKQEEQEKQGPNPEKAKDDVKKKIDKAKKMKEKMQKVQKAQKAAKKAKQVKAAAKFASGAKKFALLANPYFWIAMLIILAIIVLIGLIMSFTIMPSNFLGRCKKFVEGMMQGFCGFIWGDSTSPISNSSDDVKDLANYIQSMGYDIQGYGFGDVEYEDEDEREKVKEAANEVRDNAIDGKRNYVTDQQATQGGEIKKVYGLQAVTTVSSDKYDDGDEMYRITGRFSSKNNDYLRAYLSADAATYTEATYSIKGWFNELGDAIIKGLNDIFGGNSSSAWEDPGDVGAKAKSTGMLNFTNAGGNNIFNSTIMGSPTKIKIDAKNKKLILYEHALSIFGLTSIQWGQTFSVDLSNWTAIYGRPLELFLALHLSSMMPDLPYQIAVDQAFNTKVNINLEDVRIYFDTTITIDGHRFPIGAAASSVEETNSGSSSSSGMNRTDSTEYQIVDANYEGEETYFHSTMGGRDGRYIGKNLIYKGVTYEIWEDAGSMCTRYAFAFLASAYSCNDLTYSEIVGTTDGSTNTRYNVNTGVFEHVWENYANIDGTYYTSGADVTNVDTIVSNMANALINELPVYLYSGYRSSRGFHAVDLLGALSDGKILMYCPYAGGVFEYGNSGSLEQNLRHLVSNGDGYPVSADYGRYVIGYFIPNSAPDGSTPTNGGGTTSGIDTNKLFFIGDSWIYGTGCSYGIIPGGTTSDNYPQAHGPNYYGYSGAGTWDYSSSNIDTYNDASAIVICLGLNCTATTGNAATDNAYDMGRVIRLVQEKNPGKIIYITQTPHVGRNTGSTKNPVDWNNNIDAYNSVVRSLCDGNEVIFINPNDVITDSEGYLRDDYSGGGFHLSRDGYQAWYNKIVECIKTGDAGNTGGNNSGNYSDVRGYLSSENDWIKQRNYDEIRTAVTSGDTATLNLTDENGKAITVTISKDDLKNIRKLVNSGTNGANIKWPNIESVTNHWYYHIIDFYGTVGENTPYGTYKKAKVAKKTIKYEDEEGGLDDYNIELTALLTSDNGIYYQVCEPYLNGRPSKYLKTIFSGAYYKYDGTTETARKITAARAIEAAFGTDDADSDKFPQSVDEILNKHIKYNWHSSDSDTSKIEVSAEDADEYINAKKAQLSINAKVKGLSENTDNEDSEDDAEEDSLDEGLGEGEFETEELGEESPMCKKLVDFKSDKSNTLEAFSILENVNSEAADVNYRLLKKLMVEMDYYTEDDMNSHEKNILLWITNVEGTKGADVALKINKNLGQTDSGANKTISDTSRDANEYGVVISNFMEKTQIIAPGDAKVKEVGTDGEKGDYIEIEFTTLTDDKVYPLKDTMMLLHQDDEQSPYYNIETPYEDNPIYSAAEVMRKYRFRDTYQVFEDDDLVGITMKITGLRDIKVSEGDSIVRGQEIAGAPRNAIEGEEDSGDKIYISMKKPDKTKVENVEDYIDPIYTYEDEKYMAEQLWYLDHPEYGNKYKTTTNKKVSDYESGSQIIQGANNEETIWFTLIGIYGYSPEGAAAIMGNWYCESGLMPNNAENTYNTSSGLSDEQITEMIDSGEISRDSFANTAYGYGLAQWTYWSRKEAMYDYMKGSGLSIADLGGQIGFANTEMKNLNCYGELTDKDKTRDDIYHLTEVYHDEYERSAGRNIDARAQAALEIYDRNKDKEIPAHQGGYAGSSDIDYVQWAIDNLANDDRVGYGNPDPNDWKYSPTGSWDVDCSSLVYYSLKETRYNNEWGGICEMGTSNEDSTLTGKGFVRHSFYSLDDLQPGDILMRGTQHTEIYVGDGQTVGAHMDYDGQWGDSTGKEVNVQATGTNWSHYYRDGG